MGETGLELTLVTDDPLEVTEVAALVGIVGDTPPLLGVTGAPVTGETLPEGLVVMVPAGLTLTPAVGLVVCEAVELTPSGDMVSPFPQATATASVAKKTEASTPFPTEQRREGREPKIQRLLTIRAPG